MEPLEIPLHAELLERARERGADAELFLRQAVRHRIVVHHGKVESESHSEQRGLALRVEKGRRVGLASTTHLEPAALNECLEQALQLAELSEALPEPSIPAEDGTASPPQDIGGAEISALSRRERLEAAIAAESAAFALDARIDRSESAAWSDEVLHTRILNTHGLDRMERRGEFELSVDLVAAQGSEERTARHAARRIRPTELQAARVGEAAARKALALLGSRVHPTERAPVLLDHEVVAELLDLLSESFSARACLSGTSMLARRSGQRIAADCIHLADDPFHPLGTGRRAFDDEGVDAKRTPLVEEGILRGFLHNAHTARRMSVENSANAHRSGISGAVGIAPGQLVLRPGSRSRGDLLAAIPRGFLVTAVMGLHMADTVSGDFSLGIVGRRIEDGCQGEGVEGMTLAGNLLGLLERVAEVGSDYDPHGDLGCASVLVEDLTVSGR